ncbi:AraC family transcriptional regulator [Alkalitalea saponilacus]|uniref:AraC family transcriptional regulator n=1 Tax=Alkalitalea saponilacus TaxID=889453 RepID=A0A1T5GNG9_9BACT|nr:AraC family transcriptional regulator [Alkalitalea saponilacus]ASB48251.1 AraC family transcriptional regulator [Alkalitalea saponilacus]SKC09949.1 AraC family transcriptional regulator [Alkalitalea saponilacus]
MKPITFNHYQNSLNKAIDFINTNLKHAPDLDTLSSIAGISSFHFHRIFKAYIGESPGAYITRIRLEKAAQLLQVSKENLTEIAELTGYQNQHALSKAFKNHFGINPSSFRNIHNFFTSHIAKDEYPIIEVHPEFKYESNKKLLYIRIIDQYGAESYNDAWGRLLQYASKKGYLDGSNEFIGLCYDDPNITSHDKCRFYACITHNKEIKPEAEFGTIDLKEGKYGVFTLKGCYSGLAAMYNTIYRHWLPSAEIELRDAMSFEKYLNSPSNVKVEDLLTEIYIPIK